MTTCTRCGNEFMPKSSRNIYCADCQPILRQEAKARYRRRAAAELKAAGVRPVRGRPKGQRMAAAPLTAERRACINAACAVYPCREWAGLWAFYLCHVGDDYPAEMAAVRRVMARHVMACKTCRGEG